MGEAKQRRIAKAAGNPWPEDLPKTYPHAGRYLGDDGEWHIDGDRYHRRPRGSNPAVLLATIASMGALK
jgi:hypothetical protein